MKVEQIETAFKITDVEFVNGSTKLNFNYLRDLKDENGETLPQRILSEDVARVYLIVVDGKIKKIGGSRAAGGIKDALGIYRDGGVKGHPAVRNFGVWYFLYHMILQDKKVEFHMVYQENFKKEMKGLFGLKKVESVSISYKFVEQRRVEDYLSIEDEHPEWNVQEQGVGWPLEMKNRHTQFQASAQSREKKVKRKEARLNK